MTGLTYLAYGFDVSSFLFVSSSVQKQWNLTTVQYAIYPAATSIPNFLGAIWTSMLSDYFGRVWPYAVTLFVVGVFGIADAFSPSYAVLIVLRCLASFGIGGISVVSFPTFVEFLPRTNRAKALLLTSLFPAIGLSAATGLAWWLIPTYKENGWRYFIIAVMSPSLLAAASRLVFFFQSPRYLISRKKFHKAWKVLNTMAWMNGRDLSCLISESQFVATVADDNPARQPLREVIVIFKRPYLRRTLCLMGLIITEIAVFYGGTLFLPQELEKLHVNKYFATLVAFLAQIPGILLLSIIAEWPRVGRLNSLRFFSLIVTVFFFLLAFIQNEVTIPVFLIFIYFSLMPIQFLLYTYISESYPTNIRSLSTAFFYIIQAFTGVGATFLSAYLVSLHHTWLYSTVWGSVFLVNLVFALILNYEPRQQQLLDIAD